MTDWLHQALGAVSRTIWLSLEYFHFAINLDRWTGIR